MVSARLWKAVPDRDKDQVIDLEASRSTRPLSAQLLRRTQELENPIVVELENPTQKDLLWREDFLCN